MSYANYTLVWYVMSFEQKKEKKKKKGYGPVDPKPHYILLRKNKTAWSNS